METIGDFAFYELPSIKEISFYGNLTSVSSNAFTSRNPSDETLSVFIESKSGKFYLPKGAFSLTKKPVKLTLSNVTTILDENFFGEFFRENQKNSLVLSNNLLDCSDCRNAWIVKDRINLEPRMIYARCTEGWDFVWDDHKRIWDVTFNC